MITEGICPKEQSMPKFTRDELVSKLVSVLKNADEGDIDAAITQARVLVNKVQISAGKKISLDTHMDHMRSIGAYDFQTAHRG